MNRRATAFTAAILGCLGLLAACGGGPDPAAQHEVPADCRPAHTFPTGTPGTLTIGVISSMPYSSLNPVSQAWEGMDADFGKEFAKRECLKVNAIAVGGADAIQSLTSGKLDLLSAGAYITPARGEVVGQTDPLYYQYTVTVSRTPVGSVEALRGKQVGALSGAAYVEALRSALGADRVREYPSTSDLLTEVQNGRLDVAVTASGEARYQLDKAGATGLQVTRLDVTGLPGLESVYGVNMPYGKSNTQLGTALNAVIGDLHASGAVQPILRAWKQDDALTLSGRP